MITTTTTALILHIVPLKPISLILIYILSELMTNFIVKFLFLESADNLFLIVGEHKENDRLLNSFL